VQAAYTGGVCGQEFGTLVGAAGVCDWLRDNGHGFGVDIGGRPRTSLRSALVGK